MRILNHFFSYLTHSAVIYNSFLCREREIMNKYSRRFIYLCLTSSPTNDNEFYNTRIYIFTKMSLRKMCKIISLNNVGSEWNSLRLRKWMFRNDPEKEQISPVVLPHATASSRRKCKLLFRKVVARHATAFTCIIGKLSDAFLVFFLLNKEKKRIDVCTLRCKT